MKTNHASWWSGATLLCAALNIGTFAHADDTQWINEKLREFNADPQAFALNPSNLTKYDPETQQPVPLRSKFSFKSISSGSYLEEKDRVRLRILTGSEHDGRARILPNDDPAKLVDSLRFTRLDEIESNGLMRGRVEKAPWTDDYWPLYAGSIARRYNDNFFPNNRNWRINKEYIERFLSPRSCNPSTASPAEKYDLLVGDPNFTLTRAMLKEGEKYSDHRGNVEYWMGICDGWATASFMLPRPTHYVDVLAADGRTPLRFFPSDIKALSSLLWAKAAPRSKTIGGRCYDKKPAMDRAGRIQSQDCFDNNPATWHLSLVNQVGYARRSLVFDSAYDYQVWNQPVYSYEYSYFNPATRQSTSSLNAATIERSKFRNDVYSKYRDPKTAYIVGVAMKVTYVAEKRPTSKSPDSSRDDARLEARYFYDLEIDRNGNVTGGEWYQQNHPDFMWTYREGEKALSIGDHELSRSSPWSGREPIPYDWQKAARKSSSYGQPLAKVVETLGTLANL